MPTTPLTGKTALVTGAARRLGRAIALALADEGMSIVLHYRASRKEAETVQDLVLARGVKAWLVEADLADPAEAAALIGRACAMAGPLDALVNNASIFPQGRLDDATLEDLNGAMQVNAWAPLLIGRAFARQGREGGIVNLVDASVPEHDPRRAAYHFSKQMLHALTRAMALEFAPRVTVNAVAPGLILPPEGQGPDYLARRQGTLPLQRHGGSEDVSRAVVFLLQSGFVTGETLFVDGGRHLREAPRHG